MAKNTSEAKTQKEKKFSPRELSPDDPIFNRGYYIGRTYTVKSLKDTDEKTPESAKVKHTPEQLEKLRKASEKIWTEFVERTKMGSM